jgi:biopolymer transport protein ExbD
VNDFSTGAQKKYYFTDYSLNPVKMRNWALFCAAINCFSIACGQSPAGKGAALDDHKLTCILTGYDSLIHYTGSSSQIHEIKKGRITDTVFINAMFRTVKDRRLLLILKPGDGADIEANFQSLSKFIDEHEVTFFAMDTMDFREEKAFGFSTPPMMKDGFKQARQLTLNLPKDEGNSDTVLSSFPKASQLVVLITSSSDIYAYWGDDIRSGKKYTYPELTDLLKAKISDKDLSVLIRPSANSTYKNTVNILDVMQSTGIKHYALVDIKKEQEDYLRQIYP